MRPPTQCERYQLLEELYTQYEPIYQEALGRSLIGMIELRLKALMNHDYREQMSDRVIESRLQETANAVLRDHCLDPQYREDFYRRLSVEVSVRGYKFDIRYNDAFTQLLRGNAPVKVFQPDQHTVEIEWYKRQQQANQG